VCPGASASGQLNGTLSGGGLKLQRTSSIFRRSVVVSSHSDDAAAADADARTLNRADRVKAVLERVRCHDIGVVLRDVSML